MGRGHKINLRLFVPHKFHMRDAGEIMFFCCFFFSIMSLMRRVFSPI